MRVSTAQIFDVANWGIGRNQSELFKLQNQMSTGRRVLTPADDPLSASQALVVTQSKEVGAQFLKNQEDARGRLNMVEGHLSSVSNLLQNVRQLVVQAGNTSLTAADRQYVAEELESRFGELMGLANAQDGNGNYLFSGFQGTVQPFSATLTGAAYAGDEGVRLQQVAASRQIASSISGAELFNKIRTGNGLFSTAAAGNATVSAPAVVQNQGTGIIDQGSVVDFSAFDAALSTYPSGVQIEFSVDSTVTPPQTQYQLIFDPNPTPPAVSNPGPLTNFTPGQTISLTKAADVNGPAVDFGAAVTVSGTPVAGDRFSVQGSQNQDVFTTLRSTIDLLKTGIVPGVSGVSVTEYSNRLAASLQNISQGLENVNRVQSMVGSRLNELDALENTGESMQLQHASTLSNLQDLDYAKAISDLMRKQMQLEAAQQSFKQTSQLSLFRIL